MPPPPPPRTGAASPATSPCASRLLSERVDALVPEGEDAPVFRPGLARAAGLRVAAGDVDVLPDDRRRGVDPPLHADTDVAFLGAAARTLWDLRGEDRRDDAALALLLRGLPLLRAEGPRHAASVVVPHLVAGDELAVAVLAPGHPVSQALAALQALALALLGVADPRRRLRADLQAVVLDELGDGGLRDRGRVHAALVAGV